MLVRKISEGVLLSIVSIAVIIACLSGCGHHQAMIEERKDTMRMITEEAWNKGNLDVLDGLYAPGYVYHRASYPDIEGLDGYKQYIMDNRTTFPDLRLSLDDIVVESDRVAIRGTYTGTNDGVSSLLGTATGKEVNFSWCGIRRFDENGKIAEEWMYWEQTKFNQQLGFALHPPITENTFARVTVTQMKPDRMQEGVDLYKESVVKEARAQKGYCGIYLLSDFDTGKSLSIAIWNSEEDAIANEQSGYYKAQVDKFKDLMTAPPVRESYRVTVQN